MSRERHDAINEYRKKMSDVIAKAGCDELFKETFIAEPKTVLKAHGIVMPEDLDVKVVQQTKKRIYVVIPFKPDNAEGGSWQGGDDCYDLACVRCS